MKRLFKYCAVVSLLMMPAVSCKKEIERPVEEEDSIEVIVCGDKENTDDAATKTYAEEEFDGDKLVATHMWWSSTDQIRLYEIVDGAVKNAANSKPAGEDAKATASFKTTITGTATGSSFKYTAVYPYNCIERMDNGNYRVSIPQTQILGGPGGNNVAANADVLVGIPVDHGATRIADGEVLSYKFKRFGTLVKMTVKGLTAGETVENIEVSADVPLTGNRIVNLTTGEIASANTTSNKNIKLALNCKVPDSGDGTGNLDVWFRVLPGIWTATAANPISVKVQTYAKTYTRKIVPTSSKPEIKLSFLNAGFTSFGVTGFTSEVNHVVPDGEYVICVKRTDGTYKALSSLSSGTRLSSSDVEINAEDTVGDDGESKKALSYTGNDYNIVWVLDTDEETGITIHTPYGEYLKNSSTASASGAALDSNSPQYYAIREVENSDGVSVYNIISKSNTAYNLRYYSSGTNNYYAFYSSTSASTNAKLYLVPATDVDKTPTIILDKKSVTVHSGEDLYEFTVKKRFVKGNISAEIFENESGIIESVSVVNGNKVKVVLNPNTEKKARTAAVRVYSDDPEEEKTAEELLELTQEAATNTWEDVITPDMLKATSTSYTPFDNLAKTDVNTINSDAVYAGKTAKSTQDAIQINTTATTSGSGSGIWTTASGGLISEISVDYANANGKTIKVYGKNGSGFNGTDDEGDILLGTFSADNANINVADVPGDYEYFMLKSDGATYVNSFTIVWKEPKPQRPGLAFYYDESAVTEKHLNATVGEPFTAPVLKDENGIISVAVYTSDNTEVAEVNTKSGDVTIKKKGTVTITAAVLEDDTYSAGTASYTIDVENKLTGISLADDTAQKTEFYVGDAFSYAGIRLIATYNDGTSKTLTSDDLNEDNFRCSGFDSSEVNPNQKITISYIENHIEKTCDYYVAINEAAILYNITVPGTDANGNSVTVKNGDVKAAEGYIVTLSVKPATGYYVTSITVNNGENLKDSITNDGELKFTMPAEDITVSASFSNLYTITFNAAPDNGSVSVNGNTSGTLQVAANAEVTLVGTPSDDEHEFKKWTIKPSVDYISGSEKDATVRFSMPAENVRITGEFQKKTGYTVQTLRFTYSEHEGWTVSASDKSSYYVLNTNTSIVSPEIEYSEITSITVKTRTYGGGTYNKTDFYLGNSAESFGSVSAGSSTLTSYSTGSDSNPLVTVPGKNTIKFTSATTSAANGPGISEITINYIGKPVESGDQPGPGDDPVVNSKTVTYTVTSTTAVSTKGTAPDGSSVTFKNTYSTKDQLTSGNTMTLTLKGFVGKKITGITLSMHSNASKGAGYFSAKSGSAEFASLGASNSGITFNKFYDNNSYGADWRDVNVTLTSSPTVGSDEDVVIIIGATINSLYCQSFTIEYE